MHQFKVFSVTAALTTFTTISAFAQEEAADPAMSPEAETAAESDTGEADAVPVEEEKVAEAPESSSAKAENAGAGNSKDGGDGGRFRFGISGGPGFFSAKPKGGGTGASFTYGGMDLRFGAQLNDLVGVYAQPVLGYYSSGDVGILAVGGLIGASVVADVTLIDHFFVGGGLGYHIYNNPAGASLVLRGGAYPLMGRSKEKIRRKGLMLGADLRVTFLDGLAPVVHPTFNLGYEAF